jgi:hypothetical protein
MQTVTRIIMTSLLLLSTSCTLQQQNGNDIRLEQPFLLSDQQWKMTQQLASANDDRVCTISYGELYVALRSQHHTVVQQVGTSNKLDPGERYKILMGEHNYESVQDWFDPNQSQAIINDLMANDVAYTETRRITTVTNHAGPIWRSIDNKIATEDFRHQYIACEHFVTSGH